MKDYPDDGRYRPWESKPEKLSLGQRLKDFLGGSKKNDSDGQEYLYQSYYERDLAERKKNEQTFTRRNFLRLAAAGTGVAAGYVVNETVVKPIQQGWEQGKKVIEAVVEATAMPEPVKTKNAEIPTPMPDTFMVEKYTSSMSGVIVFLNSESIPIGYQEGDKKVMFKKEDLLASMDRAKEAGEPEIFKIIRPKEQLRTTDKNPEQNPEKPFLKELPNDAKSEADLKKRGITIIQPTNGVELFIREGAFAKGEMLDSYTPSGKNKLIIAVLDSPAIMRSAMIDKRYDLIRSLYGYGNDKEDVSVYRQEKIKSFQDDLELAREQLQKTKTTDSDTLEMAYFNIAMSKEQIEAYTDDEIVTDEDLLGELASRNAEAAGQYFSPGWGGYLDEDTAAIVVSAGDNQGGMPKLITLGFNPDGSVILNQSEMVKPTNLEPTESESFPVKEDFYLREDASANNPKSYPYGGQSAGFILRHELEHDVKINKHPSENYRNNLSEYSTDMAAMDSILRAAALRRDKKSDKGYYFGFKLKSGNIILTETERKPESNKAI